VTSFCRYSISAVHLCYERERRFSSPLMEDERMMNAYLLRKNPEYTDVQTYSTDSSMSQVASAQAVTCSDLFRLQRCAAHDCSKSIHRDVFMFRTIFTALVFVSFLLLCFLVSYLSFLIYSSLTSFVHPCPSALSIFFHLSSCPLPLSSAHPPCLISHPHYCGGGGHMAASVCCVMLLNTSRERSCCTQQAVTSCVVADVEGWRR